MRDIKLPRAKLKDLINKRLREVLVSAYLNVPYYRDLMQSVCYDPVLDYRGPEDLLKLPITTKETIKQRNFQTFIKKGCNLSQCFRDATSGSTGIPLQIYRSPFERSVQIAKWLRVLFLNGYCMRDKVMSLTSPSRLKEGRTILHKCGLLRRLAVDYLLPPKDMVDIFHKYNPDILYGNRSHLDLMALESKRQNQPLDGLKLLVGGAEVIHESCRQLYRKQFGVELIEFYGSVEMGIMAFETIKHDGLHLCEDLTIFEFLDKEEKPVLAGESGRVIVTNLVDKVMPFIRYDQGDLAVFEYTEEEAHDLAPRITKIIGREDDYAVLPDNTRRPFHDFYEVLDKYDKIFQFRIVQRSRSLFQVMIVADSFYLQSIRDDLIYELQKRFPPTVSFQIKQVDGLKPEANGKIRMLISEVSQDWKTLTSAQ